MRVIHAAVLLILAIGLAVFCVQNFETVSVKFLGWGLSLPLPVLAVLIYLMGMVSGWAVLSYLRRSWQDLTERKR